MVPEASHPVWEEFVTGRKTIHSDKATLNLLIHGNKMSYARDPSTANVRKLAGRAQQFFRQFESLFATELTLLMK